MKKRMSVVLTLTFAIQYCVPLYAAGDTVPHTPTTPTTPPIGFSAPSFSGRQSNIESVVSDLNTINNLISIQAQISQQTTRSYIPNNVPAPVAAPVIPNSFVQAAPSAVSQTPNLYVPAPSAGDPTPSPSAAVPAAADNSGTGTIVAQVSSSDSASANTSTGDTSSSATQSIATANSSAPDPSAVQSAPAKDLQTTIVESSAPPALAAEPAFTVSSSASYSPVAKAPLIPAQITSNTSAGNTDPINTLDYFVNQHAGQELYEQNNPSSVLGYSLDTAGQTVYLMKWDNSQAFVSYTWDGTYIYMTEDHSGSPDDPYTTTDAKWMSLQMAVGDTISSPDNVYHFYPDPNNPRQGSTVPYSQGYSFSNTLIQHISNYDLGGDLGLQDVIVLKYTYGDQSELEYYAKGWGLVKWQDEIFNKIKNSTPPKPDLSVSDINRTPPVQIPAMPSSLEGFVTTLYSSVLNNNAVDPASAGFQFWLNNLKNKTSTIQDTYTLFFTYQSGLSDSEFVQRLYSSVLFRPIDSTAYNNIMGGLPNGSYTRAGLVQMVLNSDEFKNNVLPKLEALVPATIGGQTPPAQLLFGPAPAMPASLSDFVSALYSSILKENVPTTNDGYQFWLGDLQKKNLSIPQAYLDFFGYQSGLNLSDDQFVQSVYNSVLFRAPALKDYNEDMAGLKNGTETRDSLVQKVLNLDEFNNNVLPKLLVLLPENEPGSVPPVAPPAVTTPPIQTPAQPPAQQAPSFGPAPSMPASMNSFVGVLYSSILKNSHPDQGGVDFWANDLRKKNLTIQQVYTDFFGYQSGLNLSDDEFTQSLYNSMLFRQPDQQSYDIIMAGLKDGTETRDGLVQKVLNSDEFKNSILSQLEILQ